MRTTLKACLLFLFLFITVLEHSRASPYISPQAQKQFPNCGFWLTDFTEAELDISADQILSVGLFPEFAALLDRELRQYAYGKGLAQKIHSEMLRFLRSNQEDADLGATIRSYADIPASGPDLLFILVNEASVISSHALHIQLNGSDVIENPPSLLLITPPTDPVTSPIAVFISHFLHEFTHHVDIRMLEKYRELNLKLPADQRDPLFIKNYKLKSNQFDPDFDEFFRETRAFFMELEVRDFFWRNPISGGRRLTDNEALEKFDRLQESFIQMLTVKSNGYPGASRFRIRSKIPKEEIFATGLSYAEQMRTFLENHQKNPNRTLTEP